MNLLAELHLNEIPDNPKPGRVLKLTFDAKNLKEEQALGYLASLFGIGGKLTIDLADTTSIIGIDIEGVDVKYNPISKEHYTEEDGVTEIWEASHIRKVNKDAEETE
jgi:hypothetical protein